MLLLVAALSSAAAPARAAYTPELACTFQDARITESSGVAAATLTPGVLFTHNDSGDGPRFFAVEASSGRTLATYTVAGAEAVDWEDMTSHGGHLYLGDIGNNNKSRATVVVYEVAEPVVVDGQDATLPLVATHRLRYPVRAHDAEALVVEPATGRLVIITKEQVQGVPSSPASVVYRASGTTDANGEEPLEAVGVLNTLPGAVTTPVGPGTLQPTGAAVTADGRRVVVRSYTSALEWQVTGGDLAAAFAGVPEVVSLPATQQGEAVTYDGDDLVVTTEGVNAPVHRLRRTP